MLTRLEAIARMCALRRRVMEERFKFEHPADCFCEDSATMPDGFRDDETVIKWIEGVVAAALLTPADCEGAPHA